MNVQEWFKQGKPYKEGVKLYQSQRFAKPNLIRLFLKKETTITVSKLEYELSKCLDDTCKLATKQVTPPSVSPPEKHLGFYKLHELHLSLHSEARQQRDLFQKSISLKILLNQLHPEDEVRALNICVEIENIFDEIDTIQKRLKYYVDHRVVLQSKIKDFTDLSPAQLLQRRNNLRITKSKISKKIQHLSNQLQEDEALSITKKIQLQIEKYSAKKIEIETNIIQLNKLINKNE